MNILFLKFFGENFKKIATENPLGFNILSANVKFIGNFQGNTISLKHHNPNSSTKLLELSFTYTNAGQSKPLKIKSVNSFKFVEQDNKTLVYTKPDAAKLTALNIPGHIRTAINGADTVPLGTITETPQKNPNMICLAVEFEPASDAVNPGFTNTTNIKITANYWNFTTMASRMNYEYSNSLEINLDDYSQNELKKFINEGIISTNQLNIYNASLSKNSKHTKYKKNFKHSNLNISRIFSINSTLIIETKTNETNILKLGTYAKQGATQDNAKILSDMLTPNLVKLNNEKLTIKTIQGETETEVASNAIQTLQGVIDASLGIAQNKPSPTTKPIAYTEESTIDETSDESTVLPTTDEDSEDKDENTVLPTTDEDSEDKDENTVLLTTDEDSEDKDENTVLPTTDEETDGTTKETDKK